MYNYNCDCYEKWWWRFRQVSVPTGKEWYLLRVNITLCDTYTYIHTIHFYLYISIIISFSLSIDRLRTPNNNIHPSYCYLIMENFGYTYKQHLYREYIYAGKKPYPFILLFIRKIYIKFCLHIYLYCNFTHMNSTTPKR